MKEKMKIIVASLIASLFMFPMYASAVSLDVVGGQLMGASEVYVSGFFYDVRFVDGTCIDLFDGCDELSDFTFTTESEALAASDALLSQVFIDGVLGNFDSVPDLTNGIDEFQLLGRAFTVYDFFQQGNEPVSLIAAGALNYSGSMADESSAPWSLLREDDSSGSYGGRENAVFAVWSSAQQVPEPSTLFLLGSGLLGLVAFRKKMRN